MKPVTSREYIRAHNACIKRNIEGILQDVEGSKKLQSVMNALEEIRQGDIFSGIYGIMTILQIDDGNVISEILARRWGK